jgi:uncharacterized membrane protein
MARWPPVVALASLLALSAVFPQKYGLLPGWASAPQWLLVGVLVGLSALAHASPLVRRFEGPVMLGVIGLVTGLVIADVARLVQLALTHGEELRGAALLSTAAVLWISNMVVFSLWYWLVDRGGPERRLRGTAAAPDLLFPRANEAALPEWTPGFFDYVFLAFTTSVAFGPAETAPLTARVKALMMLQALLSLVTLAVAVARAVNILI